MFFKKLFVCCYRFQEHVGNGDKTVLVSMGMILFAVYLYLTSIVYLKYLKNNRLNQTLSIRIPKSDKIGAVIFIIGSIISLCGVFIFIWAVNNGFIIGISERCVHSSPRRFI